MASHEFVGVVEVKSLAKVFVGSMFVVVLIELRCHFAPHLNTLNSCQKTSVLEVNPISLVEFGSDQEVKIINLAIFSDKSGR